MRLAIEKSAKSNKNTQDASKKAHDVTGVISSPKKLIIKKSKRLGRLGRFEKELVIRLVRIANGNHFVVARRRKKHVILGLDYYRKLKTVFIKAIHSNSCLLSKQELEYQNTFDYKRKKILEDSIRDIKQNIIKDSNSIDIKKTNMEPLIEKIQNYQKNTIFIDYVDLDGKQRKQYIVLNDKIIVPFNNNPSSIFMENKRGTVYINDPKYANLMQSIIERAKTLPCEYRIPHNSSYNNNENST